MSEWIRITSDEKPIEGAIVLVRLNYYKMIELGFPEAFPDRLAIALYGQNKFFYHIGLTDITHLIDAWEYPPHKFKGE
jgi:hypothetical protein